MKKRAGAYSLWKLPFDEIVSVVYVPLSAFLDKCFDRKIILGTDLGILKGTVGAVRIQPKKFRHRHLLVVGEGGQIFAR